MNDTTPRRRRLLTRCIHCGGTHTPKCRKPSRREEAEVWRAILGSWRSRLEDGAKAARIAAADALKDRS